MCVRAAHFWRAMCDRIFAHFLEQNGQKLTLFCLKNYFRTSYPILECPILFWNTLRNVKNLLKTVWKKCWFTKGAGAGAKCDHLKLKVRTCVRAHLNLDVRGTCVRPRKGSQLTPWYYVLERWFSYKWQNKLERPAFKSPVNRDIRARTNFAKSNWSNNINNIHM